MHTFKWLNLHPESWLTQEAASTRKMDLLTTQRAPMVRNLITCRWTLKNIRLGAPDGMIFLQELLHRSSHSLLNPMLKFKLTHIWRLNSQCIRTSTTKTQIWHWILESSCSIKTNLSVTWRKRILSWNTCLTRSPNKEYSSTTSTKSLRVITPTKWSNLSSLWNTTRKWLKIWWRKTPKKWSWVIGSSQKRNGRWWQNMKIW